MTLLRRISYILSAIILTVAMSLDAEAASQKRKTTQRRRQTTTTTRSADKIKKEQSTTQRKISETSKRITTTDKELKRQLNSLNSLNADIRQQDATVHRLRTHIDSLGTATYLKYLLTMTLLYCSLIFLIEAFTFFNPVRLLLRIVFSTILSMALMVGIDSFMTPQSEKRL